MAKLRVIRYETERGSEGGRHGRGVLRLFAVVELQGNDGKPNIVRTEVPQLVNHSPSGMEQGYGGSGPADLAATIIGHYTGTDKPYSGIYQEFKAIHVANAPQHESFVVTAEEIDEFLADMKAAGLDAAMLRG